MALSLDYPFLLRFQPPTQFDTRRARRRSLVVPDEAVHRARVPVPLANSRTCRAQISSNYLARTGLVHLDSALVRALAAIDQSALLAHFMGKMPPLPTIPSSPRKKNMTTEGFTNLEMANIRRQRP